MSKETQEWLDQNILVGLVHPDYGFGEAWHRKAGSDNSYDGPIPLEDVERKLFNWEPVQVTPMFEDSEGEYRPLTPGKGKPPIATVCSDNNWLLGIHTDEYARTSYRDRLIRMTQDIIGDELVIAGAGQLDGRKKAYIQILAENFVQFGNDRIYPFITATTSMDGSIANTWKTGGIRVVCDNTLEAFMQGDGRKYKFKSTTGNDVNIESARQALDIVHGLGASFEAEMRDMMAVTVSEPQWNAITMMIYPGEATKSENKRLALSDVYWNDPMVAEYSGSKWGAYQAISTYRGHYATRHGENRVESNILADLMGRTAKDDEKALAAIDKALATV